jgi:hypothetical protein
VYPSVKIEVCDMYDSTGLLEKKPVLSKRKKVSGF